MMIPTSSIYVDKAHTVDYATHAGSAKYAQVAGYISVSGSVTLSGLNITGGGTTGSLGTNQVLNISSSQTIDTIPTEKGNSVKWFVFIEDGINSRASKVVASWNNASSKFYTTEIKSVGIVPVNLSVQHFSSSISLVATPQSGNWSVRMIRILI
jgi:hypothetical protein